MQTMLEQQDAANEELRSANEEILSSNEELQSTNEELETAKEELQSTNEELSTVNEQLQFRNRELDALTNDLTNLLTSAAIPVVMVGPDLRVRRFTEAAGQTMNLLTSDIGRPIGDLKPPVDVPDLEKLIREVIDDAQVRERELRDRDGRWNLLRIHPYRTPENKINGALVLLLDIDQVKRVQQALADSEAHLRLALEAGSAGTLHRDLINGKMVWDDLANHFFGLPVDSERSYQKFLGLIHHDDRKIFDDAVAHAVEHREKFTEEIRICRPDGQTIWLLVKGQASYGKANEPLRLSGVCVDISERKRMANELDVYIAQLKENDRLKDEFLAMLAHELRNPLAPITNAVGILRNSSTTPQQAEWCRDVIDRQLAQMARLLDDLLDVSRITRNRLRFQVEEVEFRKVIDAAVETSAPLIKEKNQKLELRLPTHPVWLNADPVRLTQVISNLLNNASKYMASAGEIIVNATYERNALILSVKDAGSGISAEFLPHVFDIFVQGESTQASSQGGLGLGLTLAKRLVEMHSGTLEAKSEGEGKGSEFIVRLPASDRPPAGRQQTSASAPTEQTAKRVLVVDDRAVQAESLSMLLESMGHQTRFALDGPSALRIAEEFKPEAALIDIGLPGMDGYELARRLRQQPQFKDMLLIAQTGWGRPEDQERSREAGFNHHVAKPLNPDDLMRLLARKE
jgi:two-component system CheB/CheR fusion protein